MKNKKFSPWAWVPSLYFAEGIPYVIVMTVSVIMFKRLGISNTDIALYTGWLYLPWVIKPFWSPFVDLVKTKRWWIITMQLLIGGGLAGLAFCIPLPSFFQISLAFLWLMAFSSATHDIAADGFYMLALDEHEQSLFVGIRSTFYRFATIAGQGILVIFAGYLEKTTGNVPYAWSITFFVIAGVFFALGFYHRFVLPRPASDSLETESESKDTFFTIFADYFTKKNIGIALAFILLYRLGESQLAKLASPFLLDAPAKGGLGLETLDVGLIYGTFGIGALVVGGILGGIVVARKGIGFWLWPMILLMNLPNLVYVYLAYVQPESIWVIASAVMLEQFGYGFGFTAYMLFLIYMAQGKHQTAHYAISTGFMALGMMLPGMLSGWLQEQLGYQHFFVWVCLCTIPGFVLAKFLPINKDFGKKKNE
jgi:PAT family beta-lactamase induction signal transducer AmpG